MGKTIKCNFAMQLELLNGNTIETGVMSLKQAKNYAKARENYSGNVYLWSQTSYGKKILKGFDYLKITPFNTEYHYITD